MLPIQVVMKKFIGESLDSLKNLATWKSSVRQKKSAEWARMRAKSLIRLQSTKESESEVSVLVRRYFPKATDSDIARYIDWARRTSGSIGNSALELGKSMSWSGFVKKGRICI